MKEGFADDDADRLFIRSARLAKEQQISFSVHKVTFQKRDVVKDRKGRTLYRYEYTVVCKVDGKSDPGMSFTGNLNLVKSDHRWLADRIEPDPPETD